MINLIQDLQEMLSYGFMQRAFIGGTFLALISPLIGQFMLVKRYSGITDGISHIAILGIAVGLVLGISPTLLAVVISILIAFVIEFLRSNKVLFGETAIVFFIVFSLSLVSILQQTIGFNRSLESLLFGSISVVSRSTIWTIGVLTLISYSLILIFYKKLFNIVLSENLAKVLGVKTWIYNYVLIALTAITIALGIDLVGGLLMSSLMIIPIAASLQLEKGFKTTHVVSIFIAVFSVWMGLTASWFLNWPSGASISLVSIVSFLILLGYRFSKSV